MHKIDNIFVNTPRMCLISYTSTPISLRNCLEYLYNFSYFIYNGKKLCILPLPAVFCQYYYFDYMSYNKYTTHALQQHKKLVATCCDRLKTGPKIFLKWTQLQPSINSAVFRPATP